MESASSRPSNVLDEGWNFAQGHLLPGHVQMFGYWRSSQVKRFLTLASHLSKCVHQSTGRVSGPQGDARISKERSFWHSYVRINREESSPASASRKSRQPCGPVLLSSVNATWDDVFAFLGYAGARGH